MSRKITVGTRLTPNQVKQLSLMASNINVSLSCYLRALLTEFLQKGIIRTPYQN